MTATTTSRESHPSQGNRKFYNIGAIKIPKGVLVTFDTSEKVAINGADDAGVIFLGVSYDELDNTAGINPLDPQNLAEGANGPGIRVEKTGEFTFVWGPGSADDALIGTEACIVDNQTVAGAGTTTNDVVCGTIAQVLDATHVRVRITNYTK